MAIDRSKMDDGTASSAYQSKSETLVAAAGPTRQAAPAATVVFCTTASFHPLFWLITLAPTAALLLISLIIEEKADVDRKYTVVHVLVSITIVLILVVFFLVLPRQYEVLSDCSVNVGSYLVKKWRFSNVYVAYDHQDYWSSMLRLKVIKFAFDVDKCVLVKRRNGAWDLLLSPNDPAGFVKAVWQVTSHKDAASSRVENHQPEMGNQV